MFPHPYASPMLYAIDPPEDGVFDDEDDEDDEEEEEEEDDDEVLRS